jgi:hypothetical protein
MRERTVISILRIASALVGVAIVAAASVLLDDWYQIGVARDDSLIRAYHFGSEAMLAHGGAKYETADSYARWSLLAGLSLLPSAAAAFWAAIRTSWRSLALSGVLLVLAWVGTW